MSILRFYMDRMETPIGELVLLADDGGRLRSVDWTEHEPRFARLLRLHYGEGQYALERRDDPGGLSTALGAYFDGDLRAIEALPVETAGTPFQREVWTALRSIPPGTTISYGELARRIGRPSAVRAVGLANGANPIGVVVPCHRVIGSDGALTGYGGGIERKRWLLAHESALSPAPQMCLAL
ncbi:methylated-DNA--[protein]-cysteine S-methyltransferase [Microvirga pudoricolor]|uniref:methylated-DNA--[protein]-cysteine S-methyltransferase n=1 Tax=Microvirga pudoricolor TaxID=2778729 RepID=UPI00194E6288|nr:methylated-DNA--[protein]-cysteine S-methyltransferase [Microvirga pudoricolor]MBM6594264.1 methylated-DNA--[protein]-cysteine S-methyltransferase [Microvirga pudoricolor]